LVCIWIFFIEPITTFYSIFCEVGTWPYISPLPCGSEKVPLTDTEASFPYRFSSSLSCKMQKTIFFFGYLTLNYKPWISITDNNSIYAVKNTLLYTTSSLLYNNSCHKQWSFVKICQLSDFNENLLPQNSLYCLTDKWRCFLWDIKYWLGKQPTKSSYYTIVIHFHILFLSIWEVARWHDFLLLLSYHGFYVIYKTCQKVLNMLIFPWNLDEFIFNVKA
jgi:hypothetical protein